MWPISIKLKDMEIANIQLGYVGENDVTPVIIDCESVFSEYPNAVPTMTVQPPKGLKYPAEIERDGNNVIWTVQDYDLNYDGEGEIQIKFTENGKIKKSASCKTTIKKSIDPEAEAPTPIQDWMERAENVLESLDGLTVSAETLETGEDATAEVSEDEQGHKHIDFGLPRGPQGPGPSSEEITEAVDTYLESNFTNPSNPPLDRSLSSSSSAAPADMVGNLKSALSFVSEDVNSFIFTVGIDFDSTTKTFIERNYATSSQIQKAERTISFSIDSNAPTNLYVIIRKFSDLTPSSYLHSTGNVKNGAVYAGEYFQITLRDSDESSTGWTYDPIRYLIYSSVSKTLIEVKTASDETEQRFFNLGDLLNNTGVGLNASGTTFSSANHNTSDYFEVHTGEVFVYALRTTQPSVACFNLYSAKDANSKIASVVGVNSTTTVSGEYTVPQDGFVRVCNRVDFPTGYFYLKKGLPTVVERAISDALENFNVTTTIGKCKNQIENVYALTDWKRGGTTKRHLGLLMFSDLHGDTERLKNAISVLNGVDAVDGAIFLGDMENSNQSSNMSSQYIPAFNVATKPCFATMGNHDFHHDKSMTSNPYNLAESVARFMGAMNNASIYSENGYGYYDFTAYKVRLIILNQYEYPNTNDGTNWKYYGSGRLYQQTQIDWLITTLNNVPENYTVIIAQHSTEPANTENTIINTHYGAQNAGGVDAHSTYIGNNGYMSDSVIADIISAYMSKSTLSKSYTYSQTVEGYTGISVSADFSSANGKFACLIVGHNHAQAFCKLKTTISVYVNDTSYCLYGWATGYSLIARNQNGYSGDLLTVLCLDTDNEYLHFVRIGADRNFFGELYDVVSVPYGS